MGVCVRASHYTQRNWEWEMSRDCPEVTLHVISKLTHVIHSDIMFTICTLSSGYGFCSKGQQWGSSKVCPFLPSSSFLPSRTVTSPMLLVSFGVPGCWLLIYSYPLAEWGLLEAGENCVALVKVTHYVWLFVTPMDYTVHWILQARILERVAYPFSGIFLTQEMNRGFLHCRQILYQLSYQGLPW